MRGTNSDVFQLRNSNYVWLMTFHFYRVTAAAISSYIPPTGSFRISLTGQVRYRYDLFQEDNILSLWQHLQIGIGDRHIHLRRDIGSVCVHGGKGEQERRGRDGEMQLHSPWWRFIDQPAAVNDDDDDDAWWSWQLIWASSLRPSGPVTRRADMIHSGPSAVSGECTMQRSGACFCSARTGWQSSERRS